MEAPTTEIMIELPLETLHSLKRLQNHGGQKRSMGEVITTALRLLEEHPLHNHPLDEPAVQSS